MFLRLFTASDPPGRTVAVYAEDSTGATDETTVTIGTSLDPVGDLSAQAHPRTLNFFLLVTVPFAVTTVGRSVRRITDGGAVDGGRTRHSVERVVAGTRIGARRNRPHRAVPGLDQRLQRRPVLEVTDCEPEAGCGSA
jgi:hypothetical protein